MKFTREPKLNKVSRDSTNVFILFLHEPEHLVTMWCHTIKSLWQVELHIF